MSAQSVKIILIKDFRRKRYLSIISCHTDTGFCIEKCFVDMKISNAKQKELLENILTMKYSFL